MDGDSEQAAIDDTALAEARALVDAARRVTVLTGAGLSTDSGIPDFRGPQGLWTKDPSAERMATLSVYVAEPEVRRRAWQHRAATYGHRASPNPGHQALVALERRGTLHCLVTQNIDGLHHDAGHDPALIVEIHGTVRDVVCLRCGDRNPMGVILERVRQGDPDPSCLVTGSGGRPCGGILKSATISFGQQLVPEDLRRAEEAAATCDLLLAVGTSLGVFPAAGMVPIAAESGAAVVIVNGEPTPFDPLAAVVLRGGISEVLPALLVP